MAASTSSAVTLYAVVTLVLIFNVSENNNESETPVSADTIVSLLFLIAATSSWVSSSPIL